jgi:hypothetical protein
MRFIFLILLFLSFSLASIAQKQGKKSMKKVSTTGIIDITPEKSGYRINEYFVELSDQEVKKYAGKKVRITGKLLVVPGINPNDPVIVQGSTYDRKYITKPVIEILE